MRASSPTVTIWSVACGVAGLALGLLFGNHTAVTASSSPKIASFASTIGGKLDVFAPGVSYKTIATESGADFSATQISSIKPHTHNHSTEFLYVVSGSGDVTLRGMKHAIKPGDMISVPMGAPHGFLAHGAPLRFIEVDVPSIDAKDTHYIK